MNNKLIKTEFMFTALSMLFISILNVLAEASKYIKNFLTLNQNIGPYSGKITYGLLFAFIISFLYYLSTKESKLDITKWMIFLILSLIISCLFIFTPFIHFILNE